MSHLETDINTPGERTVALLAGLFRMEPHELVDWTSYPVAKADRLPVVVARWTEVEHQLALLDRDLRWLESADRSVARRVLAEWDAQLAALAASVHDPARAASAGRGPARRSAGNVTPDANRASPRAGRRACGRSGSPAPIRWPW